MNPKELEQSLLLAEHYFRSNNYQFAEGILKKIIGYDSSNSKANELLAYIYGNQGNFDLSLQLLRIASNHPDCSPEGLYYLGAALLKTQDYEGALISFKRSLERAGDFFEGLHDAGTACAKLNRKEDALSYYLAALNINNNSHELFFNIARTYDDLDEYDKAIQNYDIAIQLNPSYIEAQLNKAISQKNINKYQEALTSLEQLLNEQQECAEAWSNKGAILNELERFDEAIYCLNMALEIKPDYSEALSNLGGALNHLKKPQEAIVFLNKAISINPLSAEAWSNRGASFSQLKDQKSALLNFDEATRLDPNLADAWIKKALVLCDLRRYDEAIKANNKAIQINPSDNKAVHNKSLIHLSIKDFQNGLEIYDSRFEFINFKFPITLEKVPKWNLSSGNSRLLIVGEQGIGDEIFYSRFLNEISKNIKKTVIVDVRLITIFSRSFPQITFIERGAPLIENNYDYQIPMGSLSQFIARASDSSFVFKSNYLTPNNLLTKKLKESFDFQNKLICGLSWKSANKNMGKDKSLTPNDLRNILQIPGCEFINLQYGNVKDDISNAREQIGVKITEIPEIDLFNDIDGLLSIVDSCDIVITTCNVTAHLAGAIGKKTLLLVPYSQGRIWYWHDDEVSIWYPCIKQFFQDADFSWDNAIKRVAAELELEIARKN